MERVIFFLLLVKTYAQYYNLYKENPVMSEKCMGSHDILFDRHCCIVPAFFDRNVVRSCGGITEIFEVHKKEGVGMGRRHFVPDCQFWECVLEKYKILNDDKSVNNEKFYTHLEKWTAINKPYSALMMGAKIFCKQYFIMYMPLSSCEFYNFLLCIRDYLKLYDCPVLIQSKRCYEWKEFFDECKQYYIM